LRIELQWVSVKEVIVGKCRQKVMGHRNGVCIARKMQIYILHGIDLRSTATGASSFDPENRPQGRLP
jgi:hypothetical protein